MYKKKPHNSQKQRVHLSTVHHFFLSHYFKPTFQVRLRQRITFMLSHRHVFVNLTGEQKRFLVDPPFINKSFFKGSCIHYNNCQQVSVSYLFQTPPAYDYVKHNMFCGKMTWKFCYSQILTSYHMENQSVLTIITASYFTEPAIISLTSLAPWLR